MISRSGRVLCGLALMLAIPPAHADDMRAAMATLEAQDTRFQTIAWKLASANAPFCADSAPSAGLLLYDIRNFADSGDVRAALGIAGEIAVGAVAQDSSAADAGLHAGDEVLALDGQTMAGQPSAAEGDTMRVDGLHDRIDAALTRDGQVTLALPDRLVTVRGIPACRARFELVTGGEVAQADGRRVQVSASALDEITDDAVLAALLAHELAHQVLGHARRFEASGRSRAAIRASEREADRLTPWLLVNAGYEPSAALRWIDGWVRRRDWGVLGDGTHDSLRARKALVELELAAITARRAAGE